MIKRLLLSSIFCLAALSLVACTPSSPDTSVTTTTGSATTTENKIHIHSFGK